ncbi:MAG: pitrilysin family protein [Gemmatimonadetes bacterium]|nr:pitrilysin family protein [Gemmatimonadota bacterium]
MWNRLVRPCGAALFAAALTVPVSSAGQQSAADLTPLARVEGITEYQLENGLRVLLFPDPSKPQITVNITYMVGARHEAYGETGMAHLLEHLLFQGTPSHPDIPDELTSRGAQPNGTTSLDRTNYYEIFPASEDNLAWALDLEADRMINSFVSADDLASEMTVVRNEMEAGENNPFGILLERTLSTGYLWHNYGNSTIGARSDVENVPIERLKAFYRKYYQPDNAVLVVAGNFEESFALDRIVEEFASISRPDREGDNLIFSTYTAEPPQDGERSVTLRRVGDVPIAMAMYHVPPGSHEHFAAIDILSFVLGDAPSGRLYRALVEVGAATQAGSGALQLREAGPLLTFTMVAADGDITAALQTMNATTEAVLTNPVTGAEVDRAKASLLNSINQSFNSSTGIALQLSEWAAMGDWRLFFLHRDRIESTTAEDVNRVAQLYIKPDNRTVGVFRPTANPDRAEIPAAPDVASLLEGYTGRAAVAQGEAFDPSPANVDARTIEYELSNGVKVALLPKETRGDVAMVRIRLHFGDEASLMGRGTAGGMAGSMLMRGTEIRSRQEIQDELDRLQTSGSVGGGPSIATGQFQTVRDNVADVVRLMAEIVRRPAFPQLEFDVIKEQRIAGLEGSRSDPQALAQIELARRMDPRPVGHPSYNETIEEAIQAIAQTTLADAQAFYRDFWGPQSGNVVIVGDFDETEVRQAIEEAFADWQSPHAFERIGSSFLDPAPENIEIETPDKANAIIFARQHLELRDTDPDYPALIMAAEIIGGGFLNSRLSTRIRDEEGLSYGVQAVISGHPVDPVGQFAAAAIFAPENVDRVEAVLLEELEKVLAEGFTQDELDAAIQGWVESRQLGRAQDGNLAGALSQNLYFGRSFAYDAEIEDRVRALTLEEVNQAIRDRLDISKLTIVKAGDFSNKRVPIG